MTEEIFGKTGVSRWNIKIFCAQRPPGPTVHAKNLPQEPFGKPRANEAPAEAAVQKSKKLTCKMHARQPFK
jgi:hypothetical protein